MEEVSKHYVWGDGSWRKYYLCRGGSWFNDFASFFRGAFRLYYFSPDYRNWDLGFRVAIIGEAE